MLDACFLLLAFALTTGAADKGPDTVRLKDGKTLEGRVVYEGPAALRIVRGRTELEVVKENVAEVRTLERSLAEFIERYDKIPGDDTVELTELARFCTERGLTREARNLWLRMLLANPADADALEGAGGREANGKPTLQSGKRWVPFEEWSAAKSKWKDAVELGTTHFLVRTDLPVDRVLHTLVQLERHYQRFYSFLAPELVLYVFDETPEINLYANEKDYPASWSPGARSWFAPGENQMHVLVDQGLNVKQIVHELTDLLLFNAFRRSSGKTGQIPAWTVAGFANYFAATAGEKPGDPWTPLGEPFAPLFSAFTRVQKPLPIKQLMRTSLGEFDRGNDAGNRSAQAYVFVHYLMHGDNESHRALFFDELREGWNGKSIENTLLAGLGMTEDQLHEALLAHARAHGG